MQLFSLLKLNTRVKGLRCMHTIFSFHMPQTIMSLMAAATHEPKH